MNMMPTGELEQDDRTTASTGLDTPENRTELPTRDSPPEAMVRNNVPMSSWIVAASPEKEVPGPITSTASVHGAIGDHRRCSRSSASSLSNTTSPTSLEVAYYASGSDQSRTDGSNMAHSSPELEANGTIAVSDVSNHTGSTQVASDADFGIFAAAQLLELSQNGTKSVSEVSWQTGSKLVGSDADFEVFTASQIVDSKNGTKSVSEVSWQTGSKLVGSDADFEVFTASQIVDSKNGTKAVSEVSWQTGSTLVASDADFGVFTASQIVDSKNQSRSTAIGNGRATQSLPQTKPQPLLGLNVDWTPSQRDPGFSANHYVTGMNQEIQRRRRPTQGDCRQSSNLSGQGFGDAGNELYPERSLKGNQELASKLTSALSSLGGTVPQHYNDAPGRYQWNKFSSESRSRYPGNVPVYTPTDFSQPPPNLQLNGNRQFFQSVCGLCHKNYKWPHALNCLHVYCFPCLCSEFNPVAQSIVCPECSMITPLEDGPCSLKLDYQTVRYMRDRQGVPFNCTGCTRDKEAVVTCLTCAGYLCSDCKDGHEIMNQFQLHILAPITKIGKSPFGDYVVFCGTHPTQEVTRYCYVCKEVVCFLCVSHHMHPGDPNSCLTVEEVHSKAVERLKKIIEDAEIKARDLADIVKQTPGTITLMEGKRRSCRKQIDEYSAYSKNVIEANRVAAHELLDQTFNEMESDSLKWTDLVSNLSKEFRTVASFIKRTVKPGAPAETVAVLDTMEGGYNTAIEQYSTVLQGKEGLMVDLKFYPNYMESDAILGQNFLSISYWINGKEQKVVPLYGDQRSGTPGRSFAENAISRNDHLKRYSSASDAMTISHWNGGPDTRRATSSCTKQGNRTRTSFTYVFGEQGRGQKAFSEPSGQAFFKDGSYVICDTNSHRIIHYNAQHEFIQVIGQPPNVPAHVEEEQPSGGRYKPALRHEGCLYFPNRVSICPNTQNIVVTSRPPSHDIQIYSSEGKFIRCFGGNILQHPRGVTVDENGLIIVVESKVMRVMIFRQDGEHTATISVLSQVQFPNDVAARDGQIFISDNLENCVHVFTYDGKFVNRIGNGSLTYHPISVSINHLNQVVVTDNHNAFNITVFDMSGKLLHLYESTHKLDKCHSVAINPSSLELMLTTRDCTVFFFGYDPEGIHPPKPHPSIGHYYQMRASNSRRPRGNGYHTSPSPH